MTKIGGTTGSTSGAKLPAKRTGSSHTVNGIGMPLPVRMMR